MRKKGDLYEYIAAYVYILAIAMKYPKERTDILENHQKFKLKGTGPISFHLGMDFTRDDDKMITPCVSRQLSTLTNLSRTMRSYLT
jgi:hypothetical protein